MKQITKYSIIVVAILLGKVVYAEITVSIYPKQQPLTWTIYSESGIDTLALVRTATCAPVGATFTLQYSNYTTTILMGSVETRNTILTPIPKYETTISVHIGSKDYVTLINLIPLVWCSDVNINKYRVITITKTLSERTITKIPIYYTTTLKNLIPMITTITQSPDLIVPSISYSTTYVTTVLTHYNITTITSNVTLTELGSVLLTNTHYPYAFLVQQPLTTMVKVPATLKIHNKLSKMIITVVLDVPSSLDVPNSNNDSGITSVSLLTPLAIALKRRVAVRSKEQGSKYV